RRKIGGVEADQAARGIAWQVVRLKPESLVVVPDGKLIIALVAMKIAACTIPCGIFRIDLHSLIIIGNGAGIVSLAQPDRASLDVKRSAARIDPNCLVVIRYRSTEIPFANMNASLHHQAGKDVIVFASIELNGLVVICKCFPILALQAPCISAGYI